jgi:hypothetical protein
MTPTATSILVLGNIWYTHCYITYEYTRLGQNDCYECTCIKQTVSYTHNYEYTHTRKKMVDQNRTIPKLSVFKKGRRQLLNFCCNTHTLYQARSEIAVSFLCRFQAEFVPIGHVELHVTVGSIWSFKENPTWKHHYQVLTWDELSKLCWLEHMFVTLAFLTNKTLI